jgi:hypothetical protein
MGILGIVVVAEAEAVPRIEPARPGLETIVGAANVDDGGRQAHGSILRSRGEREPKPAEIRWQVTECLGDTGVAGSFSHEL